MTKKHILIISFAYPPLSAIGARRIGMLTKGLYDNGFIPHVITAKNPPQKHTIDNLIPAEYVHYVNWLDIWRLKYFLEKFKLTRFFGKMIGYLFPFGANNIPERRRYFWIKPAMNKALEIIQKYDIQLIYSSYTPPATIRIASELKGKTGIPWINEYRDLWTGNPYINISDKRFKRNLKIEKKLISIADALVTVSEPLKRDLEKLHNKPTFVIYNGIDILSTHKKENLSKTRSDKITFVHAGTIYKGKRDPTPFFEALKQIRIEKENLYNQLSVSFYGPGLEKILGDTISRLNLDGVVKLYDSVSHNEILKIQSQADVLLLLGWNNKADEGVLTGKIFEYLGMMKPILGLGYPSGAIDSVLQKTKTGKIINNPQEIAEYIENITEIIKNKESLYLFQNSISIEPYLRKNQINNLVKIFNNIIDA